MRDRVRTQCSMTVRSDISAVLPVAVPRFRAPGWGWLQARGRSRNGESRSRTHCLEREQVLSSLGLLGCGILFGLFVGGFAGYMENATPHGSAPCSFEQMATLPPTGKWAVMLRQYHATSGSELQSVAESQGASRPQLLAAVASMVAEPPASAASEFSIEVEPGLAQAGGKHDK